MSGRFGAVGKSIDNRKRKRKGFGGLLDRLEQKRRVSEPQNVIGYDGTNFTRNGQKTTRDSLRMG